jgi:hypothetical protein
VCEEITHNPTITRYLEGAIRDIYWWQPAQWRDDLDRCCPNLPPANRSRAVTRKANMFWEELAVALGARLMGYRAGLPGQHHLMSALAHGYGPGCAATGAQTDAEWLECSDTGIPDAAQITVVTSIDGARDVLNPITRQINVTTIHPYAVVPASYSISVAQGLRVASPHHEVVNLVPSWQGQLPGATIKIIGLAAEPPGRPHSFNFPDFNLAFIPFRHLVLQGPVANPKESQSSLSYASAPALQSAASTLVERLFNSSSVPEVVAELMPFFTEKYYYMFGEYNFSFDGTPGVEGYKKYVLASEFGITGGLASRFSEVKLEIIVEEEQQLQSPGLDPWAIVGASCGIAVLGAGVVLLVRQRRIHYCVRPPVQSFPVHDDDIELLDFIDQDVLEPEPA